MKLYAIMRDDTQEIIPVEARSKDDAYARAEESYGSDLRAWPCYDVANDDDMMQIIHIVAKARAAGNA